jgi:predicted GIY-YIG superfamily endonuclease
MDESNQVEDSKQTDDSRYEDSKIYCLYCTDDYYYIGSTKNELRFRLRDHKQHSNNFPTRKVYEHINKLGWKNVKIQLLEDYPCKTREELLKKENEYIRACNGDPYCLNLNN